MREKILDNSYIAILKSGVICVIGVLLMAGSPLAENLQLSPNTKIKNAIIEGAVFDEETGEAISHVTVQIPGSGRATKTNYDGCYRMILKPGSYEFKVSHVGYYSQKYTISLSDSALTKDVYLKTSVYDLGERDVYSRAYDPAQRIIAEAIRRKKDILSQIHDYSFDAYSKLVLCDANKLSSENIFLITESQSKSYWEQPDKYKEVISARKQSANLSAEGNLVAVGQMLNFNRNRVDLGRYDVVSPTARDAIDYYNYYLLDTVYIDEKAVFVLEVEPKNEYKPLFVGEIHIADSSFDVVKVDVGFSRGIQLPMIDSARYYQSMAQIDDRYWMPVEIGLTGKVTFDIPFPGIPKNIIFSHIASIYSYRIDAGHPDRTFGEYDIEVDNGADDIDSTEWDEHQMIPLTAWEKRGYERIDSVKNAPKPIYKHALKGLAAAAMIMTFGYHDIFHYNRVEGPYTGFGFRSDRWIPNTRLQMKTGYSFENKFWQYEYGISYRFLKSRKLWLGGSIKDEIVHRPTVISRPGFNSTANALLRKIDPFDYYREKGVSGYLSIKPVNHTRFRIGFRDYHQLSESKKTDYGFFRTKIIPRENPPIVDGRMRSVSATLSYDSRKLINSKGRDLISSTSRFVRMEAGIEYASPDFIRNDYDFRWYYFRLQSRIMLSGSGLMGLTGYIGSSDGDLPPQRQFIADFHDPDFFKQTGFSTVGENSFTGDRVAMVYAVDDFGAHMFRNSGIEFLKKLPVGFTIHGGAMWIEFRRPPMLSEESLRTAPTAYSEIGFGLSNLTPFIMPFNLAINFTWQLSAYDTNRFSIMIDFKL
jgi:hypothetical protein